MAPSGANGNSSSDAVTDGSPRTLGEEFALPIETDAPPSTASFTAPESPPASSLSPSTTASTELLQTTPVTADAPDQDMTVAIALVVTILLVVIVFTLIYVLYQRRRQICGTHGHRDKNKPDLSANEVLITPVKANGGATESSPPPAGQLVSGPREARSRQAVPRKWYDSAALKYMDQSTDTLDRV